MFVRSSGNEIGERLGERAKISLERTARKIKTLGKKGG